MSQHTVQSGEDLSQIALKFYRDGSETSWRKIYEANKGVIGDCPTKLRPGQVLNIP